MEAEHLYIRGLQLRESLLGAGHPEVARVLNNLAMLYESSGRLEDARLSLARALPIFERTLGPTHPNTKACRKNYARLELAESRRHQSENRR